MDMLENVEKRVSWIRSLLERTGAKGIVYGNSGGKDCTLVSFLCARACGNVTGILMPCEPGSSYEQDRKDALEAAAMAGVRSVEIDLTAAKKALREAMGGEIGDCPMAYANMNPRLRMTALYAYAQSHGCLVAGTGNRSERMTGYFTKWGDGACDFNPVSDLTAREVYAMLDFMGAPVEILTKPPSAGLYEGQTDEKEMGLSYKDIDDFLLYGTGDPDTVSKIKKRISSTAHKRAPFPVFREI